MVDGSGCRWSSPGRGRVGRHSELRRSLLATEWIRSHLTQICSGSEAGSYLRLIDSCITQLNAQGSGNCNESKEEEEEEGYAA